MSTSGFIATRIIRLYPLLLLGMSMGIAVSFVKMALVFGYSEIDRFLVAALMGMLLLPFATVPPSTQIYAYPFNGPTWSLFFEFGINLIYAVLVRFISAAALAAILAASGSAIVLIAVTRATLDGGGDLETVYIGASRVTFSFFAGVTLYRLHKLGRLPTLGTTGALIATILLVAILLFPPIEHGGILDCVCVLIVFPAIIATSLGGTPTGIFGDVASFVGRLSYPVYITHYPVMRVFQYIAGTLNLQGLSLFALVLATFISIIIVAYAADRLLDMPIQRFLSHFKNRLARPSQNAVAKG